jgi:putative transposase
VRRKNFVARRHWWSSKKSPGNLGGRGRRHTRRERERVMNWIEEAVARGATRADAADAFGISARSVERWQKKDGYGDDLRHGPKRRPSNALSASERKRVIEMAQTRRFRDLPPAQIVPQLADEGLYLASEWTSYRVLKASGQLQHRAPSRPRESRAPERHRATERNQVWSWDITYLRDPVKGSFFYLYLIEDVWSRKIVGAVVHEAESNELAAQLTEQACLKENARPGLVLHSDNGSPMKSATMLATLQRLGVSPSFSRPHVSDDNAYCEALFRTLKYRPGYPRNGFASLADAQVWVAKFIEWYNHVHRHSGIGFVTPSQRPEETDGALLAARRKVYEQARRRHPERWSRGARPWSRPDVVELNPKKGERTDNLPKAA